MRAAFLTIGFVVSAILLTPSLVFAGSGTQCEHIIPRLEPFQKMGVEVTGLNFGIVRNQYVIQPGANRLARKDNVRLIEIERLWGLGFKSVLLDGEASGGASDKIKAVHMIVNLSSRSMYGIGVWSLEIALGDRRLDLFKDFSIHKTYLDGVETTFEGLPNFQILRLAEGGWRSLTIVFNEPISVERFKSFDFYARTLFQEPWAPANLLHGKRVDACVFFIR